MLRFDVPGLGECAASHLVCDFTGTLEVDGALVTGVADIVSGDIAGAFAFLKNVDHIRATLRGQETHGIQ